MCHGMPTAVPALLGLAGNVDARSCFRAAPPSHCAAKCHAIAAPVSALAFHILCRAQPDVQHSL